MNINKIQQEHLKAVAMDTSVIAWLTGLDSISFFLKFDFISDDCSHFMWCFQSHMGLCMSVICIQRYFLVVLFYSTFKNVLLEPCFFSLFMFLILFELLLHL